MDKQFVSKTTNLEQLHYAVDAAGKMVNAATNMSSSQTLHKAAHEAINHAEDIIETALRSSSEVDQLAAAFEEETLNKIEHQLDVSGHHNFDQ